MQSEQIRYFLEKFALGNYSEEEHQQFIDWLKTASMKEVESKVEEYKSIAGSRPALMNANPQLIAQIEAALDQYELGSERQKSSKAKVVWLHRYKNMAAAAVLILLGSAYFLLFNKTAKQTEIVKTAVPDDVKAPASNRAMITLANGQKVYLDSAGNGTLATQGDVNVIKTGDGQIIYDNPQLTTHKQQIDYNTLSNPRGSKVINMILADGSKVWLNAGSSLTYPVAFIGTERKVSITGEAYFEVAKVSSPPTDRGGREGAIPFKVSNGKMEVTVLGTRFNVNAYDDEDATKVTLLEGSVKINKGNATSLLKPGQQARISSDIKTGSDIDMDEVMAWKNGKFQFGEAADIATIMRQIVRWYDVDVEYKGAIAGHIGGTMSRNVNVSQVFKMLEMTGAVRFQIDGKKVIVMPK
jgi:transmembrane sensor